MPVESITAFNGGLVTEPAPHRLAANEAVMVENCHIRDGAIRPMLAAVLAASILTGCQSIYKFNGAWETHSGDCYFAEENEVLYWADGGVPQKKRASDGAQARLGIEPPVWAFGISPSASSTASSNRFLLPQAGLSYAVTFYSDPLLGGWGGESAPAVLGVGESYVTPILDGSLLAADAEIFIRDEAGSVPSSGMLKIDDEYIIYASKTTVGFGTFKLHGLARGANGSTAADHASGSTFAIYFAQVDLSDLPVSSDPQVTTKRIYRVAGGEYRLVAEIPNATTAYTDVLVDEQLGDVITSDDNDPPPNLTGICGPYNGMFFGWLGNVLYSSKVGVPDAWGERFQFKRPIAACVIHGGSVVVLCEDAPYIISGDDPNVLYRSKALSQQGCLFGRTAVDAGPVLLYLSPDGVCALDGLTSRVVSDALAKSDLTLADPHAAYHDEQYFLFHAGGCIIGDFHGGRPIWRTCTETGISAYRDDAEDTLYIGRVDGVYEWGAGGSLPWRYWTGELVAGSLAQSKEFWFLILHAVGQFRCQLFVDGENLHDDTETLPERESYRVRLGGASRGYRPQLRLEGSGTVYAVEIEHSGPGRSR